MPTLIITVGLPAAGKSTRAKQWVAENPARRARVNRDDLRAMLHGGRLGTSDQEDQVTHAQHAAVRALLGAGVDVVCDDTNLRAAHREQFAVIAAECGAELVMWDMRHVDVAVCVSRDAGRPSGERVGAEVIRAMAAAAE